MTVLTSLKGLEACAFSRPGHCTCYRACDIAPVLGVTASHVSKVRRNNPARFPADFYLGSGIYTTSGVLALASCLRTKQAAAVSVELLREMADHA
jgi:hypothetical protein